MPTRWREGSVWTQTSGLNLYEKEVLADAPVAYWRFREAAGTTVEDVTGNGHDGTTVNGVVLNTSSLDGIGSAAGFDGTDDYVDMGSPSALNITGDLTLEAWVKTTSTGVAIITWANNHTAFPFHFDIVDTPALRLNRDGTTVESNNSVDDGNWHHVVITDDRANDQVTFYIDGVIDAQKSYTPAPSTGDGNLTLSRESTQFFNGEMDEPAVCDFVLSAQRVEDHYRAAFNTYHATVLSDDPTAYWRFGEESGATTAVDETGNGWDGTYNGDPSFGQDGALSFKDDDGAVYMDGAGDAVDLGDVIDPQTGSFTVESWIKVDDVSVEGQRIQVKEDGTNGWAISVGDSGQSGAIRFFIRDSATFTSLDTATGVISNGVWHHIVGVYDASAGTRKIYVDAVEEASATDDTGGFSSNTAGYGLAARVEGGVQNELAGVGDEFAVYESALSATRIQAHYDKANR